MNIITSIKSMCVLVICALLPMVGMAQSKSVKRGMCWDEKTQSLTNEPIEKMLPGVSWIYNWGVRPARDVSVLDGKDGMVFVPMCWSVNFNEKELRAYIEAHPGVKYLLGFNEPNFLYQANLTPKAAASKWDKVEKIAADYKLRLVAPVLNFTGDKVGGKTWTPYEWLDEFIKQYKQKHKRLPQMDCLALHCYMNWYGSSTWFTIDYFYHDLFNESMDVHGKYPHIVELMEDYKASKGHYPRMMLTEFCSWEGDKDGFVTTTESQIDQMTQKMQKMEQSDLVEGYAWFMANNNATRPPYYSIFQTNWPDSELSDLGKVYVYLSSFDTNHYYEPDTRVQAKDYVDASTDDKQVRIRPNSEEGSELPLQVEFQSGSSADYLITVPKGGKYQFCLHARAYAETAFSLSVEGAETAKAAIAATSKWQDSGVEITLSEGRHTLRISNVGAASFWANAWNFTAE